MSSSGEHPERLKFGIKAVGDFTRRIKDDKPGTKAYLDGPYGVFKSDRYEDSAGFVCIGGGIGITPIMSMLVTAAERGDERPFLLIYASKSWDDITYREALDELKKRLDLTFVRSGSRSPGVPHPFPTLLIHVPGRIHLALALGSQLLSKSSSCHTG